MISPKQLKLGAGILIGTIMGFAVVSYVIVSSQYEQISLNAMGDQEVSEAEADPCAKDEVKVRYEYVGSDSGAKSDVEGHNTVSKMLFLQVGFGTVLIVLAIIGLIVGIVLSIIYNKRAAISLGIAVGVFLMVYLGSGLLTKQWKTKPYQVYQEHVEDLGTSNDAPDANPLPNAPEEPDSLKEDGATEAAPVTCGEEDEEELYSEGLVNRSAAGVYTLLGFLILGLLAVLFAIVYPIVLTQLPSKK